MLCCFQVLLYTTTAFGLKLDSACSIFKQASIRCSEHGKKISGSSNINMFFSNYLSST
jgi:hypothetical protein